MTFIIIYFLSFHIVRDRRMNDKTHAETVATHTAFCTIWQQIQTLECHRNYSMYYGEWKEFSCVVVFMNLLLYLLQDEHLIVSLRYDCCEQFTKK